MFYCRNTRAQVIPSSQKINPFMKSTDLKIGKKPVFLAKICFNLGGTSIITSHCWYCKRRGHIRAECNFFKAKRTPGSESPQYISRGRGRGRGKGSGQRMFINVGGTSVSLYF